jgi:cob(I)alamin adenosyltransferase
MAQQTGLIHYYYGDGKGKTTAALGLALRAAGAGRRVLVAQFLKGSPYSELNSLHTLGIAVRQTEQVKKFTFQMNDEEKAAARLDCENLLQYAKNAASDGTVDVLILDEVTDAVSAGMIAQNDLLSLIDGRSDDVELVLTGHIPNEAVVERADYVTEMAKKKHPFDRGVAARRGIEF